MNIETERLLLQEMTDENLTDLKEILQDPQVMYAYLRTFGNQDVLDWYHHQKKRYENNMGLLAMIDKKTGIMVGQAGLTMQKAEDEEVLEIGYLLKKKYWHMGYAIEAAQALKKFAFENMNADTVYCIISTTNISSQKVAEKLGMKVLRKFDKEYKGRRIPHYLYGIHKTEQN